MRPCPWKYITAAVSSVILSFLLQEDDEEHLEYSSSLEEEKKKMLWQVDQEKISSEIKNHLETFKEMQKNSLLQQAEYTFLAGALTQEKSECMAGSGQTGRRADKGSQRGKGGWVKQEMSWRRKEGTLGEGHTLEPGAAWNPECIFLPPAAPLND